MTQYLIGTILVFASSTIVGIIGSTIGVESGEGVAGGDGAGGIVEPPPVIICSHELEEVIISATCLNDGEKYQKCKKCTYTTNEESLAATGHNFSAIGIDHDAGMWDSGGNCGCDEFNLVTDPTKYSWYDCRSQYCILEFKCINVDPSGNECGETKETEAVFYDHNREMYYGGAPSTSYEIAFGDWTCTRCGLRNPNRSHVDEPR